MANPQQIEKRIILLTSIGHCLCHLCELAVAGVIPALMLEFSLHQVDLAWLTIPGFMLFGIGAVPSGVWADRRGSYEAMNGFFLFIAVSCLLVFSSTTTFGLGIAFAVLGAANSIYHPAGLAMISHGCQNRGRAMGINGVAGSLGVALGPSLGIFFAIYFSWRYTYLVIAIIAAISLLASLAMGRSLKRIEQHPAHSKTKEEEGQPLSIFWILFLAMMLGGINYRCVTTALPNFFSTDQKQPHQIDMVEPEKAIASQGEAVALQNTESIGIVFLIFACGGIGQLLGGFLADRFRPANLYIATILLTVPFALLIGRVHANYAWVMGVCFAIFLFAEQPLENTIIAEATAAKWRSTIYGLKFIVAFGLGSFGMYLAGYVWRHYGLVRVFDAYATGAVAMAAIGWIYCRKSNRN